MITELLNIVKKYKEKKILIALKGSPDPDAIASSLALSALFEKNEVKGKIYHDHTVSLPSNNRMINELDISLIKIDSFKNVEKDFDAYAVMDFQTADLELEIPCVVHIDHHKDVKQKTKAEYQDKRTDLGSTSTIMSLYFKETDFLKEWPNARNLATALAFGIRTDTDNLTIASKLDIEALLYLADYYDKNVLQSISRTTLTKIGMGALIKALDPQTANITIKDNWLFAGVGYLKASQRDTLAMIADILIAVDGVDSSVVYGIVENDKTNLEGCVRTFDFSYDLNNLLNNISDNSGAKKNKGAFKIPLGDFACVSDKEKLWDLVKDLIMTKFSSKIDFSVKEK